MILIHWFIERISSGMKIMKKNSRNRIGNRFYEHLSYLLRGERRNDENHEWARDSSRHENARTQIWWQLKITWCILHILIVSAILIIFILLICLLLLYSCTPPLLRSSFATVKIFFKLLSHEGYFIFLANSSSIFFSRNYTVQRRRPHDARRHTPMNTRTQILSLWAPLNDWPGRSRDSRSHLGASLSTGTSPTIESIVPLNPEINLKKCEHLLQVEDLNPDG